MKKVLRTIGALLVLLVIIYLAGPSPKNIKIHKLIGLINLYVTDIEDYVSQHEEVIEHIKPGNEAKIIWAGEKGEATPYSVVYLHGFSASQQEGDPIHRNFAKRYGCNLYLARLSKHGLDSGFALNGLNVEDYVESAKIAIAVGQSIGDSVIVMSTSTGGSLALYIASGKNNISSLICYSPNIRVKDPKADLLNDPWGKQIAEFILGSPIYTWEGDDSTQAYWSTSYPVSALVAMQEFLEKTMNKETFKEIKKPLFLGYYYKNETEQDDVVSVEKALEMYDNLGTPEHLKRKIAFPKAGHHVIASRHKSADVKGVQAETYKFAEEILKLKPVE